MEGDNLLSGTHLDGPYDHEEPRALEVKGGLLYPFHLITFVEHAGDNSLERRRRKNSPRLEHLVAEPCLFWIDMEGSITVPTPIDIP